MATQTSAICEPCSKRKKNIEATKWCSDCEESLCKECTECHLFMKATQSHHVVDLMVAHSFAADSHIGYKYCEIHEGLKYEYFCSDHQTLCCHECMASVLHRTCRKMLSVDSVSKHAKTSKRFKQVEEELKHVLETLDHITKDRRQNITDIKSHVDSVKDSVTLVKLNIIKQLDVLEKTVLEDLERIKKNAVAGLASEDGDALTEKEVIQVYRKQMDYIKRHGSDKQAFLFALKLKVALHDSKDQLISKIARLRTVSLAHTISDKYLAQLTLGTVSVVENPCTEKFKLHVEDFKFYHKFVLSRKVDMTVLDKNAFITGMAIVGNKLFLCNCDWNHNSPKVLVCDANGDFLGEIEMAGAPWDIAEIPKENKAVVVLPNINAIQFLDAEHLKPEKVIKMPGSDEKRGITASKDRIYVGGTDGYIYILDSTGVLLSTVFVKGEKFCYLLSVSKGDLVYSDFQSIHRVRTDGKEVYKYSSSDLVNPKKIAIDQLGNLYIAGKDSHSLHRLTPDGTLLDIIQPENVGLYHPRAVCFDSGSNKLFISNQGGKELLVIDCS